VKKKRVWLGLGLSAFFLYLAFRKTDWNQTWTVIQNVGFFWVLVSMPLLALAFWFRALRWRYLLLPVGRPGLHSLFGAIMIGFMSLNLLPLRLGEFIRAYVLGRREGLSKSGVFATVVIERIYDGFMVLLLLVLALIFLTMPLSPEVMAWVKAFTYLGAIIYLGAVVFLVAAKQKTGLIIRIIHRLLQRFPGWQKRAAGLISSFASGLTALGDWRLFLVVTAYSLLVWLASAAFYWVVMLGFQSAGEANLGWQVGPFGGVFVLVAIALGIMIPSGPGFVGTFELACIMALVGLGVDKSTAESYAIVVHASQFIPISLVGIVYLYVQNFSFREIKAGGETAQEEMAGAESTFGGGSKPDFRERPMKDKKI